MAIALTPDHRTTSRISKARSAGEELPAWRLPAPHLQDLRDVARGVEETNAGVCTRYLDGERISGASLPDEHDAVPLYEAEAFVDRFSSWHDRGWRRRILRARRALLRLEVSGDARSAAILHVAYGYPDPLTRGWPEEVARVLSEPGIASLVRYADATEERRRRLVRRELVEGMRRAPLEGGGLSELSKLVDLGKLRDRERWIDRAVTSADALRDALAPFPLSRPPRRPGEDERAHAERCRPWEELKNAHRAERASFVLAARAGASAMLSAASRAYNQSWLAVAV